MGKQPEIKILDTVHCKADPKARESILQCLRIKKQVWERGDYGGSLKIKNLYAITGYKGTSGHFLTGLLPRVKKFCQEKKIDIKITGKQENLKSTTRPKIEGIKFRHDQYKAFRRVKKYQRGKIVFPTGSGKTIIALGIFSMYPKCTRLFLCHTKDLLFQTIEELERYGFKYFAIGGGKKSNWKDIENSNAPIVVAIINSFANIEIEKYISFFDITIVDEVHHVNAKNSRYGYVMNHNLSPIKIGLTATQPTDYEQLLINEGYFGPIIAELTIEEGIEEGIIATPAINLIAVPYEININKKGNYKYKDIYKYGIIKNSTRNKLIAQEAILTIAFGHSTLIVVEQIEHGEEIKKAFKKIRFKKNIPFIQGNTDKITRIKTKKQLSDKKIHIVICTKVWKEGINIPTLNHVILASGMKDEKQVLQPLGRGLRIADKKESVKLTDFLDPYRYLAEHSIARLHIYRRNKWI